MAVFLIALFGLSMVTMETGDDTYIDKDTPRGALLSHYKDTYGSDAIMLIFECDDVTDPAVLKYIDRLEETIRRERYIDSASGITDMMKQINGGVLPSSVAEVSAIKSAIPAATLERYLPSSMMTITGVTQEPGIQSTVQQKVLDTSGRSSASPGTHTTSPSRLRPRPVLCSNGLETVALQTA